jgi:microcystin-dependent protein
MSEFFIGQIMMAGFNFAPKFWALSNGQLLPINQNQALFSLLGTQYGGNGTTNFALPDLRSHMPIGQASTVENITLLSTNLPAKTHSDECLDCQPRPVASEYPALHRRQLLHRAI